MRFLILGLLLTLLATIDFVLAHGRIKYPPPLGKASEHNHFYNMPLNYEKKKFKVDLPNEFPCKNRLPGLNLATVDPKTTFTAGKQAYFEYV